MNKIRLRMAFLFTWGLLMLSAQVPLLVIFSAINYETYSIAIGEILAAILTSMMAALMVVKEDL